MGYSLELSCPECGYERQLRLGQGMRDCTLEVVLPNFSEDTQSQIKKMLSSKFDFWNYERRMVRCPKCKEYQSIPVMEISLGKTKKTIVDNCPCGETIVGEAIFVEQASKCPRCKGHLTCKTVEYWD